MCDVVTRSVDVVSVEVAAAVLVDSVVPSCVVLGCVPVLGDGVPDVVVFGPQIPSSVSSVAATKIKMLAFIHDTIRYDTIR